MNKILNKGNPVLRKKAKPVPLHDIKSGKIARVIERMRRALAPHEDGVAIAAPQIGESLRLFLVAGHVFLREEHKEKGATHPDMVFINPEFVKRSRKKKMMHEGCLSARWLYGFVERSEKTTVSAYDEQGKKFTYGGSGLLSQIFQHEIDHLDGVLFIDKAEDLQEIPPPAKNHA